MIAPRPTCPPEGANSAASGVLAALLEARAGQTLASDRAWRIETALRPLLRERGLETLDQLVSRLLSDRDPAIGDRIVEALLNGETSFLRDPAVFDTVADWLGTAPAGTRRRIWSAGCSTGQEPLSLALLLAERAEEQGRAPNRPMPDIIATDLSGAAIARAQAGRYTQFEIQRGLAIRRAMRWFEPQGEGEWVVKPALLDAILYRRLNLVDESWAIGRFDVILCRNVLLYLAPAYRSAVFARLAAALKPGGILVLGAGETVIGQTRLFEPSRTVRGVYERAVGETREVA